MFKVAVPQRVVNAVVKEADASIAGLVITGLAVGVLVLLTHILTPAEEENINVESPAE